MEREVTAVPKAEASVLATQDLAIPARAVAMLAPRVMEMPVGMGGTVAVMGEVKAEVKAEGMVAATVVGTEEVTGEATAENRL